MNRVRVLVGVATLLLGCNATRRPYGQPEYELAELRFHRPARAARQQTGPVIAVGIFDDETVAPIGVSLEGEQLESGTARRTYHYWALVPKLRDEIVRALRARGRRVYRHDLDIGEPAPLPERHYPDGIVVLRGAVERFGFTRHRQGVDVVAAEVRLWIVRGRTGDVLWSGRKTVRLGIRTGSGDAFAAAADALVAKIAADASFKSGLQRAGSTTAMAAQGGAR